MVMNKYDRMYGVPALSCSSISDKLGIFTSLRDNDNANQRIRLPTCKSFCFDMHMRKIYTWTI